MSKKNFSTIALIAMVSFLLSACGASDEDPDIGSEQPSDRASTNSATSTPSEQSTQPLPFEYPRGWDIPQMEDIDVTRYQFNYDLFNELTYSSVLGKPKMPDEPERWIKRTADQWKTEPDAKLVVSNPGMKPNFVSGASATAEKDGTFDFRYWITDETDKKRTWVPHPTPLPAVLDAVPRPPNVEFFDAEVVYQNSKKPMYVLYTNDDTVEGELKDWLRSLNSAGKDVSRSETSVVTDEYSISFRPIAATVKTERDNAIMNLYKIIVIVKNHDPKVFPDPAYHPDGVAQDLEPTTGTPEDVDAIPSESKITLPEGAHKAAGGSIPAGAAKMSRSLTPSLYDDYPYQVQSPSGNLSCVLSDFHEGMTCVIRSGWEDGIQAVADIPLTGESTFKILSSDYGWMAAEAPNLEYGQVAYRGNYACASEESGLTCWNSKTGHGLFMNREGFKPF